jgi:WD40 repeat protein
MGVAFLLRKCAVAASSQKLFHRLGSDYYSAVNPKVSLENGFVVNFDARALPSSADVRSTVSPARITLQAHDSAASALDVNPHIRGCVVTGGTDKMVKVWDVNPGDESGEKRASLVTSRDLGVVSDFFPHYHPICCSTLLLMHILTSLGTFFLLLYTGQSLYGNVLT